MGNNQSEEQHIEYLRRNLLVCKAVSAHANAKAALKRLQAQRRPPKWLVEYLEGIVHRTDPLAADMAAWRDLAPDKPHWDGPLFRRIGAT